MPASTNFCIPIALCCCALLTACSKKAPDLPSEEARTTDRPTVYTVNYPLAYFAERVAASSAQVVFPAPADVDPAFWTPSPDEIRSFQHAELIFTNGAGYERWMQHTTLPSSRLRVTTKGCRDHFLRTTETVSHRHGPEGEHSHGALAFTTWLDLELARCQAGNVRDGLAERLPSAKAGLDARFDDLDAELLALDRRLHAAGKRLEGQSLLASHPVYQYFADAYGLSLRSLHLEPDRELDEAAWAEVDAAVRSRPASWMLWEARPLPSTSEGLKARGVGVVVFNPTANVPSEGDFLTQMRANVERFECAAGVRECR